MDVCWNQLFNARQKCNTFDANQKASERFEVWLRGAGYFLQTGTESRDGKWWLHLIASINEIRHDSKFAAFGRFQKVWRSLGLWSRGHARPPGSYLSTVINCLTSEQFWQYKYGQFWQYWILLNTRVGSGIYLLEWLTTLLDWSMMGKQ